MKSDHVPFWKLFQIIVLAFKDKKTPSNLEGVVCLLWFFRHSLECHHGAWFDSFLVVLKGTWLYQLD